MNSTCSICSANFSVPQEDLDFYDQISPVFQGQKFSIPPPKICPQCRQRERYIWRPELHLHQRKCDFSGATILSMFSKDAPCVVYNTEDWWSDAWNPLEYGVDYNCTKPFFEQLKTLVQTVPLTATSTGGEMINSDYMNSTSWCKNCYLLAGGNYNEDCYYGNFINHSRDCMDCSFIDHCEGCYECIDCTKCYMLQHAQQCSNCSNSAFLFSCRNCKDCFGCVNLVEKQYCYLNQQLTKQEYESRMQIVDLSIRSKVQEASVYFAKHRLKFPHLYMTGDMNENVTGNSVIRSKNCQDCYDMSDCEDCKHCGWFHGSKTCQDCYAWGLSAQECYRNMEVGGNSSRVLFSVLIYTSANMLYCINCRSSKNCFGCVSLKSAEYCIFNTQYTKEEYEQLVPKIIVHMQETGEWGTFFPYSLCPIAYNESIAQDYLSLSKAEVVALGARWAEEGVIKHTDETKVPPDQLKDTHDSICSERFTCTKSSKDWKIIPQEYAFYTKYNIALPDSHYYVRHTKRLAMRNARTLHTRKCAKCSAVIQSTYGPDRPEIVYCKECYLQEVY